MLFRLAVILAVLPAVGVPGLLGGDFGAFRGVEYIGCYDGDTCTFNLPGLPGLFGERIPVRLAGVDTPEMRSRCPREKELARRMLAAAQEIDLMEPRRGKYFRIVARIVADGHDIAAALLKAGLAVEYDGGRKGNPWCPPSAGAG